MNISTAHVFTNSKNAITINKAICFIAFITTSIFPDIFLNYSYFLAIFTVTSKHIAWIGICNSPKVCIFINSSIFTRCSKTILVNQFVATAIIIDLITFVLPNYPLPILKLWLNLINRLMLNLLLKPSDYISNKHIIIFTPFSCFIKIATKPFKIFNKSFPYPLILTFRKLWHIVLHPVLETFIMRISLHHYLDCINQFVISFFVVHNHLF